MIDWKTLVIGTALLFGTGGIALHAQTATTNSTSKTTTNTTSTKATTTHHEMGTVDSITNSELLLTHKRMGKTENTKFTMNAGTKKDGTINKGEQVEVYYHVQNKERIASEVKPEAKS